MNTARVLRPVERPAEQRYVAPRLTVIGSVPELTQTHIRQSSGGSWCAWNKTIGPPDYFTFIPISNCSP